MDIDQEQVKKIKEGVICLSSSISAGLVAMNITYTFTKSRVVAVVVGGFVGVGAGLKAKDAFNDAAHNNARPENDNKPDGPKGPWG